jgi:GNAT superfamily N-acetyltransferase
LLRLAEMVEAIDPKAALDIYRRAARNGGGENAYNVVRTAVWAGLDVTQELIHACEGPWRLLALCAVARHLVSHGKNEQAAVIRDDIRVKLEEACGPGYDAAAFELALLDRCEACRIDDARKSGELLQSLRILAGHDESLLALVLISEADQALTEGNLAAAAIALEDVEVLDVHGRDLNVMARTALGRAMLSHVQGFHEEAFVLANGAAPVIAALEGGFALRAAGIAGRAALLCGAHWDPPSALFERYPRVWTKALTEAVAARHVLATDPLASMKAAESALALATHHESPTLASYARVSLAAALDSLGNEDAAQHVRLIAWETALRTGDRFALYDIFVHPHARAHDIGCMRLDGAFVRALQKYIEETVGDLRNVLNVRIALSEALRMAVSASAGRVVTSPLMPAVLDRKQQDVLAIAGTAGSHAVSILVHPSERERFEERFMRAWHELTTAVFDLSEDEEQRAG